MQIALALLVIALIVVLYRDWEFFSSNSASNPQSEAKVETSRQAGTPPKISISKQPQKLKQSPVSKETLVPVFTASNRAVLPPLEVEVVAGGKHRKVQSNDASIRLDLQSDNPRSVQTDTSPASKIADSETSPDSSAGNATVSAGAAKVVSHPVQPTYPVLARQMKVQGAVVLQALINKEGNIESLQVLSGPSMLSVAAREAVKQWHFKPFFQAGQPVETETRITVNFTISTN
jgi:TonB family protein